MELVLICLGKIKEKYLTDAINEYTKRIKPFCNLKIIELKEINSNDDKKNLSTEAVDILNNIMMNKIKIEKKGTAVPDGTKLEVKTPKAPTTKEDK